MDIPEVRIDVDKWAGNAPEGWEDEASPATGEANGPVGGVG
jgi:hypothetical protein